MEDFDPTLPEFVPFGAFLNRSQTEMLDFGLHKAVE